MKLAIVCCLHGNEKYGLEVMKKLSSHASFFIGNPLAVKKNKRFIDSDLNRSFPGNKNGNYEEKQAHTLLKELKYSNYVLDLHSSSNNCPLFGIITKPNKDKIEFARKLGLKKLVIMPKHFASGKSLIDFVKCGISLEVGPHERKENVSEVVNLIKNLEENNPKDKLEIYQIFSIIPKKEGKILIENFQEVKKGQIISKRRLTQKARFDFTPVLVNEKSYKGVLCLACKKANTNKF